MSNILLKFRQRIGDWLNEYNPKLCDSQTFRGPLLEKKKVLILSAITSSEDKETIAAIKKEVREMCPRAEIHTIGYCADKGESLISDKYEEYFTEKDLSFFFKIKSNRLIEALGAGYDIMIVVNRGESVSLNYIAKFALASLRVGCAGTVLDKEGILNFVIEHNGEGTQISKKMRSCLEMVFENQIV